LGVGFFIFIERKFLGLTHYREGPNKLLYKGYFQFLIDIIKLLFKDFVNLFNPLEIFATKYLDINLCASISQQKSARFYVRVFILMEFLSVKVENLVCQRKKNLYSYVCKKMQKKPYKNYQISLNLFLKCMYIQHCTNNELFMCYC